MLLQKGDQVTPLLGHENPHSPQSFALEEVRVSQPLDAASLSPPGNDLALPSDSWRCPRSDGAKDRPLPSRIGRTRRRSTSTLPARTPTPFALATTSLVVARGSGDGDGDGDGDGGEACSDDSCAEKGLMVFSVHYADASLSKVALAHLSRFRHGWRLATAITDSRAPDTRTLRPNR
jgi:hypothetical protein